MSPSDIRKADSELPPQQQTGREPLSTKKRNAFTELMNSKRPKPPTTSSSPPPPSSSSTPSSLPLHRHAQQRPKHHRHHHQHNPTDARSGLLPYILHPETYPSTVVLRYTESTVLIRDLYPKATVHLLLLPRSEIHRDLHPHEAFQDIPFLNLVKQEVQEAVNLAASELERLCGPYSKRSKEREDAIEAVFSSSTQQPTAAVAAVEPTKQTPPPPPLPPGRDWTSEIRVGIHAHPSMSHLHVHIISRDMHSERVKHRKHYNSFNTDFFIPLDEYPDLVLDSPFPSAVIAVAAAPPLAAAAAAAGGGGGGGGGGGKERKEMLKSTRHQNDNLRHDFICWRCGGDFGNRFKELKAHLDREFLEWRAE